MLSRVQVLDSSDEDDSSSDDLPLLELAEDDLAPPPGPEPSVEGAVMPFHLSRLGLLSLSGFSHLFSPLSFCAMQTR